MPQQLIPVYRKFQPIWTSPCELGKPCPTCARHRHCVSDRACQQCRRGAPYVCERRAPAMPAYLIPLRSAMSMLYRGEAYLVHQKTAIQLTFKDVEHLRDISAHVDPEVIRQYVRGIRRFRIAVDLGWHVPPRIVRLKRTRQRSAQLGFAR